jgi:hypothetical protein
MYHRDQHNTRVRLNWGMALPVAPQAVTLYDLVKDLGFPIAVALILLFQTAPRLDSVIATNAAITAQLTELTAVCADRSGGS